MTRGDVPVLGATRLRVLNSLPRPHQAHFFEEIRKLCANYIASLRIPMTDRESESLELFSEVMAKLLGVAGSSTGQSVGENDEESLPTWTVNDDPKRDEHVSWLLSEVGGRSALAHRHEDIRRKRHGGKWREDGYRQVQLDEEHFEKLSVDPDDPHHEKDIRHVWRGVLAMAKTEFKPNEDISILLDLMAHDADIADGFGSEWPIREIVDALNQRHPNPPWNDDRVDNAKKRLRNWIARLKRNHGLDSTDLMGLFARYAGRHEYG